MPSATLTFHPDKNESNGSTVSALLPSAAMMPSRSTAIKGVAVVASVGVCYWAYCYASDWVKNVSLTDFFLPAKDEKEE